MASLSLGPHSFATLLQHPSSSSFSPASLTPGLQVSKHYPAWNLSLAHHHHRHPIHAAANDYSNSTEAIFPGSQFSIHHQLNVSSHFVQALPTHAANAIAASVENPTTTTLYYKEAEAKIAAPVEVEDVPIKVVQHSAEEMRGWIDTIRGMFRSMSLGEISISAYDTAWVALVPSLNDSGGPQFPKSLDWIIKNQLPDGSWGDRELFLSYDRICSTVACLVALKTWNVGLDNIQRGVEFIHGNLAKMEVEVEDSMPIGFEVVFPTMLDDARVLGLDLPYDSPMVRKIREEREKKLKRIPMEALHSHPTTLLHSLEGLHSMVDWKRLLKLQSKNGSFLFSPASTACALMYTGDKKCLDYLNSVLVKFDNAVPNVYPVDLFERMWVVDRLERLGISRYFKSEIKECLDYVYRYWTQNGIGWASESDVYDADDTAMGFRLLRLHGYDVSPEVFRRFKKGDEFFCFEGQTSQAVTGMYNLYRASQTMLPGESILHEIKLFTKSFLLNKQKKNEIKDKWIIAKDLKGEVEYALNHPWYQSLPRIEARYYIDQYGVDDIWIGKSLYKMFYVNNEALLNLARADYNLCQNFHQKELAQVLRWNKQCQFDKLKFARQKPIECFFSIASTLFEPEYSLARIVWAMCGVLTTIIDDFFDVKGSLKELNDFLDAVKSWDPKLAKDFSQEMKILFMGLYNTMNNVNQEAFVAQGRDISSHLRHFFVRWITSTLTEAQWRNSNHSPSLEEYMENAKTSIALEPIVQTTLFFLGERISEEDVMHEDYFTIMDMVNMVGRLNNDIQGFKRETSEGKWSSVTIYLKENPNATEEDAIQHFKLLIEHAMVSLVKEYLRDTSLPRQCKQVHLNMAKIMNLFYRKSDGFTSITEMSQHVNNILYTAIF